VQDFVEMDPPDFVEMGPPEYKGVTPPGSGYSPRGIEVPILRV
jgi:hypothetical protein